MRLSLLIKAVLVLCPFVSPLAQPIQNSGGYQPLSPLQQKIIDKCRYVVENKQTVDQFTPGALRNLPVGIVRETPAGTFVIAIDSAFSNEQGWFFSAYAAITFPGTTEQLVFAARNIAFNSGGLASSSQMKLLLVSEHHLHVNDDLSIKFPSDGHNFLEWDCNGFKAISLKGDFIFSDNVFIPDPERAKNQTEVTAPFEVHTSDLSNIMIATSITPFKIKGIDDFSFQVTNAVADFSDNVNPAGFSFPKEYQQLYGDNIQLWRGFYLGQVDVRFTGFQQENRKDLTIAAKNLLIDDMGLSGNFTVENLLPLEEGSTDGWPFSIDRMGVKLMFSKVYNGSLNGKMIIPFLGDEPVDYLAEIEQQDSELKYRFSANIVHDREYAAPFAAKIKLHKSSTISLETVNGKLVPSTSLNGLISINHANVTAKNLRFERLCLTTEKPYIKSGIFSTDGDGQSKSVGFPITIDSIGAAVFDGKAAIGMSVSLNLMNKTDKGFSANTFIQLLAKMEEQKSVSSGPEGETVTKKRQRWELEKVKVNNITLKAKTGALTFAGELSIFDNDPVYGNGFMGTLSMSVPKVLENISVNGYFGSRETFRYWHVDANIPKKVPLVAPVYIQSLSGGASYHMVRQSAFNPDFTNLGNEKTSEREADIYLPDEKALTSLLAGVTLVVAHEKAANGDAILEVAFNNNGGIRYAQFTGNMFFFSPPDERERNANLKTQPKASAFARLDMRFDNQNNSFHSSLKTYLDVAQTIRGTGPNGLIGEGVIHVDPKNWYIYIGRPAEMMGVDIAKLAVVRSYFMVGNVIEPLPSPPREVKEIFDEIDDRIMRDNSAAARGRGFAVGARFRTGFDTKEKIKPFYAVMNIGAGSDIMLRDYGDAMCSGRSGKIGIDGWYASGQAYVFLLGKVGIRVGGRNFDFLRLGAAALLQAKLPNPAWMKGQLGGRYSILGGLIKGKFNVKFVVGEECEIIDPGSDIDDIKVIEDLKPDDGTHEVSVFAAPQVSFNTEIEKEFAMMDQQDKINSYRIRVEEFTLKEGENNIAAHVVWNTGHDVAMLRTDEILPPQTTLTTTIKIYWEEKSANGVWQKITSNGKTVYESRQVSFVTGTAPDFIPEENIRYSYPASEQFNFHPKEYGEGYIKLRVGQAYLFPSSTEGVQWKYVARFEDLKRNIIEAPLNYDVSKANITFAIPQALSLQSIYRLEFLKRPLENAGMDTNVKRSEVVVQHSGENEISKTSNTLTRTITQDVSTSIYRSTFRTSKFSTFEEKWTSFGPMADMFDIATGNIAVIGKRGAGETFDELELSGRKESSPLVQVEATSDTRWLQEHMSPVMYDNYPIANSVTLTWRDPSVLGIQPLKGVRLANNVDSYTLTENEVAVNNSASKLGQISIGYYLSYYVFRDLNELKNKAAKAYLNDWNKAPDAVRKLLIQPYVDLEPGIYPVNVSYVLPGINRQTFKKQISIKF